MKNFLKNKDESNNEKKEKDEMKKGFFKKVWYSIDKIEKYSELSAEGIGRAIKYLVILMVILSIISSVVTVYKTSLKIKNIAQYINENSPEFTYNDGTLLVNSEEVVTDDSSDYGKVIIDTKTDSEEQINQYINQVSDEENAIIILKNKLILKEAGIEGTVDYTYKELFKEMGINELNKQQLVDYLTSSNMMSLYLNLFLALFIYVFIIYFINTLLYIVTISVVGYLATLILKLKIRYVAVFNMAVYAVTLPTILNMIYLIVNAFYTYTIDFDIMYLLIASIYVIAAVFMLKSEFNKKQGEVQKIVEVEKDVKEEMEEKQKEEKKENKEKNKETGKKDKKKKEETKEENTNGEEPEGSNA